MAPAAAALPALNTQELGAAAHVVEKLIVHVVTDPVPTVTLNALSLPVTDAPVPQLEIVGVPPLSPTKPQLVPL